MIDPPRPEAKAAVATCRKAGIKPVMITGDHVVTASAIAKALGIMEPGDRAITGAELDAMTDDNFATIVDAVREGRGIYANIRKVVGFLLGTNIGEVITVFAAMLLWHKTPLVSMQLLWINLVTDSLPAIALGMEAVESDVMDRKPKPKDEGIFAHGLGVQVVLQGLMFALLTLIGPFSNHMLNWAALISLALVCLVLFTPVGIAFGLITLPWELYLLGLGLILVPLLVMEISKVIGLIRHCH